MSSTTGSTHVLVYPYPSSGHIIPILDLTHRFLTRGLTVTVAITPQNLRLLDPFISSDRLHHVLLPNPQIPPSAINRLIATTRSFRELHYPLLLHWFRSHASPPVAVISDFFLGWTQELAQDVGVRRVVFSPSGALAFSVESTVWRDLPQNESNTENNDDDFVVSLRNIPNSPKYPWWQISHLYRMFNAGDAEWEFLRGCYLSDLASWGIIVNSFVELEGRYIDHLKTGYGSDRVWAVGPVLPSEIDNLSGPTDRGGSSSVPCYEVLTWLDSCEDNSVVYVCFGSRTVLTCEQMEELAGGLEKSGVRFILCVREQPYDGILPGGFDDRVSGRGMVIRGWAPQVPILRHRATGVFLTHCGWNSVLEGITAGVVMLTWPMNADQFTNANLVVDELGVGVRVGEASRRIPDSYMLAQALVESVEANEKERAKAKKLKEIALSDVRRGRSDKDMDALVQSLYELNNVNA